MKKVLLLILVLLAVVTLQAQTISIVSPEGLSAPYEVAPGTEVTFMFDYYDEPPTKIFSYNEEPVMPDFGTDPAWSESTNYVNNGDGTFNFTLTINEDLWVWTGFYQSFISMWAYSNILHFQIASGVEIAYDDGIVCGDGVGVETLSVQGTFDTYQWYLNGEVIDGATSNTYNALYAGAYKVQVMVGSVPTFSNTLNVEEAEMILTGSYTAGSAFVEMEGSSGFDSYQWLSGSDEGNISPINGETSSTYGATLEEEIVYYAVSGVVDGCIVSSSARAISIDAFTIPSIVMNADTNAFGNVCEETVIALSVNDNYETYNWFKDGIETYNQNATITISQTYQQGSYYVNVNPIDWPEIIISSAAVSATYFELIQPNLITDVSGPYCPGEEVNVILGDEGYDYSWYVHTDYQYTEADLIDNNEAFWNITFQNEIRVTVVGSYQGCMSSNTIVLNSATNNTPSISFVNWDEQYLCTDSLTEIQVSPWSAADFDNYQWYKLVGGNEVLLTGETAPLISVSETGIYFVKADLIACENTLVQSSTIEVYDYSERELYIYADMEELCLGNETNLNISGGDSWQNIQWFKEKIVMGQSGYEKQLTPMIAGIGETTVGVEEFTGYVAKARYTTCPTGTKITSNLVKIKPAINPDITIEPSYGVNSWHLALYDSIPSYLYCTGEPVTVSVSSGFSSYTWHLQGYSGDDDYLLGEELPGATEQSTSVIATGADWVTAKVELDGCIGVSDPVLIDTWVFSPPAIASYNNSELCGVGDSTLMHSAFSGSYVYFEWYLNGILIPNSNNDSIWATEIGEYTLTVYREECPEFGMSTGVGPYVSIFQASILENDSVIYAMPEVGEYSYQWYLNGEPIDSPSNTPWILYKDEMADGIYTVEISNSSGCVSLSPPYQWDITGLTSLHDRAFYVHPNPTKGNLILEGLPSGQIEGIRMTTIEGRVVQPMQKWQTQNIDLSNLDAGVYILEVLLKENVKLTRKIIRVE